MAANSLARRSGRLSLFFFFQAEDGIRYLTVTGVQTCALPISICRRSVADGPVPPGVPGYAPVRPIPTNPDSARRLLGGRHIAFELLTVGSGEGALEQMIQARLAAVGFDVAIRQLELTAFLARVNSRQRDFTAAVLGTPGDPGLGYLQTLAELAGVRPAPDPASAQRLFRDSLPVAFLYHVRGVQGMNRRVSGVRMDVRGELPTIAGWRTEP